MPHGPTRFDREPAPAGNGVYSPLQAEADHSAGGTAAEVRIFDIVAELNWLIEGSSGPRPTETTAGLSRKLKGE